MAENSGKKISPELIKKIEQCVTPEELVKLAKENNVEISDEEAMNVLNSMNKELSDAELKAIAGGRLEYWSCMEKCPEAVS